MNQSLNPFPLGMYGKLYTYFSPLYLAFYPISKLLPQVFRYLFLEDDFTRESFLPYQRLFLAVMISVAPAYYLSIFLNQVELFDVFCLQRVFIVGPAILFTVLAGQNVYNDYHPLIAVFVLDVLGALVHGCLAPGSWRGIFRRFDRHLRNSPLTPCHAALRFESYMGLVHGIMVTAQMTLTTNDRLAAFIVTVAITLQFVLFWYAAHDLSDASTKAILLARIVFAGGLRHLIGHDDADFAGTVNLQAHYWSLVLGAFFPILGGLRSGVGTLYSYSVTYIRQESPLYWMIGWAIVLLITSSLWRIMFFDYYDNGQKERLGRSNRQDVFLAAFMIVVAVVLTRTKTLGPETVGEPIGYILPLATLWFSNEIKLLNHNKVGSPFLPSWCADGRLPKFAQSELINITFGVGAVLITIVLTSYAFFAISTSLGINIDVGISVRKELWKLLAFHGIFMILTSGLWMIAASSGLGAFGSSPIFEMLEIPPLSKTNNPRECISVHILDLMAGILLLALSAVINLSGEYAHTLIKTTILTIWIVSIVAKVCVHYRCWVFTEPTGRIIDNIEP